MLARVDTRELSGKEQRKRPRNARDALVNNGNSSGAHGIPALGTTHISRACQKCLEDLPARSQNQEEVMGKKRNLIDQAQCIQDTSPLPTKTSSINTPRCVE